ncbi:MAG TPA: adenylate kinase [Clostridiales bacterium]|jgi:adenylate kinase|nr:adenylate kinase [Clostridium sp.]MEE1379095.1 adenylate kinase [Clostridia bacterium]OKZ57721.1 MAG: adenylate kinase [Clostridium sp. 26_21]CDE54113.1 adenylate kinase [Clostridium sp. CAG:269]HCQ55331.1 adenylate kinase [Clostridiales bacterium]
MNIIMLGAQGTGKGTVAGLISEQTGLPQISTGDIFRKNISEKTPLGVEADKYISKGNLVPDDITVPMVEDRLTWDDAKNGVILDGFPRTIEQAEKLDKILAKKGEKIDLVINLVTPKEEIIDRMLTRRVCTNQDCKATYNIKLHPPVKEGICDKCGSPLKQRADDSDPEAIKRRLEIYEEKTSPLVEYYKEKGVLRTETVSISINRMGKDVANDVVRDIKK